MDIHVLTADEYRWILHLYSLGIKPDKIAAVVDVPLRAVQKAIAIC